MELVNDDNRGGKLKQFFSFRWFVKGVKKFFDKDKNYFKRIMFSISFVLILVGSFMSSLIQRDFGEIEITSLRLPMPNNQLIAADLMKPKSATPENPAPLIIVVPGFQRTKETQIGVSLELARRGFVVITIDPYNQGDSTSSNSSQSATTEGYGLFNVIEYIYNTNNINYIDKSKIAATGHSAGGNACIRAAAHFGLEAVETGESKLHSVYISGYIETITDSVMRDSIGVNMAIGYALYDEGAFRAQNANNDVNKNNDYKNADMRYAAESLRFVNSVLVNPIEEVEIGKVYGHPEERNLRMVFNENTIHALQPYSKTANAHIVEFFEISLDWNSEKGYYDQTWMYKEMFSLASLVGAFLLLLPLAALLLQIPFFASVKSEVPPAIAPKKGLEKLFWWATIVIGITIAAATFIPFCNLSLTMFKDAANSKQTWYFPQRMNNAVLIWAFLNGLIGIALFLINHFACKILLKKGSSIEQWGVKISIKNLIKTVVLGFLIVSIVYLLVTMIYYLWHVDFRFTFFSIQPFQQIFLKVIPMYIPFYFVFYFSNSFTLNELEK